MLLVFPLSVIASFRGKRAGGNFIYRICRYWSDCWFFAIGIRHRNLDSDLPDPAKQYVFVANHISYLDIPLILKTIRYHTVRALGKAEMKRVPVFGFIYRNTAVMVDRSNPEARAKSVKILKSVLNRGISIFIFPEGTFNETRRPLKNFYDGAFRIAIETQTPIKPILFLDTYTLYNYHSLFSLRPGRSRALFLPEIDTQGLTREDLPRLKQRVYDLMQESLVANKAGWIGR